MQIAAGPSNDQIQQLITLLSQLVQFTGHVSTGAMTAHMIQWLKDKPFFGTLWKAAGDKARIVMAMLAASLPAAGITFTFIHTQPHEYGVVLDNITSGTVVTFIWSLLQNWVMQQGWYQMVIKPKPIVQTQPIAVVPVVPIVPAQG